MAMLQSEDAVSLDIYPYLEGGALLDESDATIAGGGFVINDKWDFGVNYASKGDTDTGTHDRFRILSVSRIVQPGWFGNHAVGLVGVSKIDDVPMVGAYNFNIGLGIQWRTGKLICMHYSSLNVYEDNDGIGSCKLRLNF